MQDENRSPYIGIFKTGLLKRTLSSGKNSCAIMQWNFRRKGFLSLAVSLWLFTTLQYKGLEMQQRQKGVGFLYES